MEIGMDVPIFVFKKNMCDISNVINAAKETIILIDDVVDEETVEQIEKVKIPEVRVKIYSRNRCFASLKNVRRRKQFQAGFSFIQTNAFKDRYLMIDGKMLFMMTRSLKYNGRRRFYYMRVMGDRELVNVKKWCEQCESNAARMYRHF